MKVLWQDHTTKKSNWESICVFSHYDPNGKVEDYVLHYLTVLQACGFSTVFVSTSPNLDSSSITKLRGKVIAIILRENVGYDFGSYKTGIEFALGKATPERLLITNDSVFGPLFSITKIVQQAENFDLFGITDSYDHHYHLQSYFILYGPRILKDPSFSSFWEHVELLDGTKLDLKRQIILKYEVGGSQHFIKQGFSTGVAFPFTELAKSVFDDFTILLEKSKSEPNTTIPPLSINYNATHRYWRKLIESGCPFLKRELLLANPSNTEISDWADVVTENSKYDLTLILNALRNFSGNDNFFFVTPPTEIAQKMDAEGYVKLCIASSLRPYQGMYGVPEMRGFRFVEQRYLQLYPDVQAAVMEGAIGSGLIHFKQFGASEGRNACLETAISN